MTVRPYLTLPVSARVVAWPLKALKTTSLGLDELELLR